MKKLFSLIAASLLITSIVIPASAQDEDMIFPAKLRFLNDNDKLPENLLYTKSVVFVNVPPKSGTSLRGNWKGFASQSHHSFRKAGVDAVAYYYLDDAEAGREVSKKLAEELKRREVQNLIFLNQTQLEVAGKATEKFTLLVTPFNGKRSFVSHGQEAYKLTAKNPEKLFSEFEKDVFRNELEVQNHLISDQPEFFVGAGNIIKGKRFEGFARDLKLDKLAVPRFEENDAPQAPSSGGSTSEILQEETEGSSKAAKRNNQILASMMAAYPYEYDLVDPQLEENRLRQDGGYQFILLRVHTTGEHVKKMLGYEMSPDEKEYTTMKQDGTKVASQQIPAKVPVYKYYIKHIYTGDVYLGTPWDADKDWQEALANYINNMKKDLNIEK